MDRKKYDLQLILGLDLYIKELDLLVHQPTLEEYGITMMSTNEIYQIINILAIDGSEQGVSNFDAFMLIYSKIESNIRNNLMLVLDLLFPNSEITFLQGRSIYIGLKIGEIAKIVMIDQNNFNLFQEVIKDIFCTTPIKDNEPEYNTKEGTLADEIRKKILKGRKEVAERKASFNKGDFGDLWVNYISIVAVSTGISFNEIKKFTLYQLHDILNRYNLWFEFDLDLRIRLAGGDSKKSVEPWTKNIH